MNTLLITILLIISFSFIFETIVSILNITVLSSALPEEFGDIYNKNDYVHSQRYTRATTFLVLIQSSFSTLLTILFLLLGGFNSVDIWVRNFGLNEIITGLLYVGTLLTFSFLLSLPFSLYSTFIIEHKFGFNRTTLPTYILDILKSVFLVAVLGTPLMALILWFFTNSGPNGWFFCWTGVVLFSLILQFFAPVLIMPLFNTFSPLPKSPLLTMIFSYVEKENFTIKGIYTMDGSKRSSKVNAFFTGFGRFRKIVFFDTLVEKLENQEIVAVLAHEMGHLKLKHIFKMFVGSTLQTGIMFYLLSLFLGNNLISAAFQMQHTSIYSSLVFFGFLYTPVNMFVSLLFNALSRKHEFEADAFAAHTLNSSKHLINSLKKLSQLNLNNLTPHPLYVIIHYSHPPVLERIQRLRQNCF